MDNFDWKLTIKTNILMLKIAGLWPAGDETYKFNSYTFYAVTSLFIFVFGHNFFQSFNIIFIVDDLQALTGTIFITLTEMLSILKSYHLIQNMKILKQLMVTLNSKMFQPKYAKQMKLIQPNLSLWKNLYSVYGILVICDVLFFAVFPILDNSAKEHRLPFLAWYPYDTKISPFYEMTYIYQIVSVSFVASVNLNIDTLIAALNMYIGAQCDILCDNLRNIQKLPDVNQRVINCVKHHQAITKFAEDSNNFFNWIAMLQFFTSCVSLSMTMFMLTVVPAFSSEFYTYMFYGNSVVMQIFVYCWFGNEVETKSSSIPYAVFESNWTGTSLEVQKKLIVFIMRSQKPIKVSALNLFYLSLDTFVKILRTSWSYFAVLSQANKGT